MKDDKSSSTNVAKLPKLDGAEPRVIWHNYFADQKPEPEAVAQLVLRLHEQRQYAHVIACIETALIESQPQPWMYEVLALSMKLAGRPKKEIERVLLSRVDFSGSDLPDMLISAAYLKRMGFDEQALARYRQAAQLAPTRPEPYILGLRIARERKDADAVVWGATGVLTNVWQTGYEAHHREAEDIAAVVEQFLRHAKRDAEANTLTAAMAAAHQRDMMLKLTWNGSADLDLSVEEPNGGVCSIDNPFSEAGGAYPRDGYGPKAANCVEEYVCASGLPGDYLVRVRLISGAVVGQRAELKIRRYVGTPDETTKTMSVPIDGKDKVIRLTLNEGRRTSLLEKPIHDGPLTPLQRPLAVVTTKTSRQFAGGASRQFVGGGAAVTGSGNAVGFQPTITTIPEGIGMSALAVVTGDRRYVRISVAPFFSQIIEVNTFTFQSTR